jgi:ectoine hydroxylase-related dioxygenase (phytanoyl-CoA dioxygenase family)
MDIRAELDNKGYCIIPNVISSEEITEAKRLFYTWQKTIPNHNKLHNIIDPHGIYKYHQVGHQEHAWYIRTRPKVIEIYKKIWGCDDLVVSFDGTCYISKDMKKKDNIWTHTDQAPNSKGLQCYQGFVALTSNKERTIVVYEGSHLYHEKYFEEKGINNSKNWQLIEHNTLEKMNAQKRVLNVAAGSLVLWDSRTFHQNQYGAPNSEERIVQYVCYLPKNDKKNTKSQQEKRLKYFKELRTTSHWPYPIKVNGLQPQTFGNNDRNICYNTLKAPDLERFDSIIKTLI